MKNRKDNRDGEKKRETKITVTDKRLKAITDRLKQLDMYGKRTRGLGRKEYFLNAIVELWGIDEYADEYLPTRKSLRRKTIEQLWAIVRDYSTMHRETKEEEEKMENEYACTDALMDFMGIDINKGEEGRMAKRKDGSNAGIEKYCGHCKTWYIVWKLQTVCGVCNREGLRE